MRGSEATERGEGVEGGCEGGIDRRVRDTANVYRARSIGRAVTKL